MYKTNKRLEYGDLFEDMRPSIQADPDRGCVVILQDRMKHGCFIRAPMDGYTACPGE